MNSDSRTPHGQLLSARDVHAGALAVGPHATATYNQNVIQAAPVLDAVAELRRQLNLLDLSEAQRHSVAKEVKGLETAMRATPPDPPGAASHLRSFADKLEMTGKVVTTIAGLAGPVRTIAEALQIPLHLLGF